VDEQPSSYPEPPQRVDGVSALPLTRRALRQQDQPRSRGWLRKGAAAGVVLGLAFATYGFVAVAGQGEQATSALSPSAQAEPPRVNPPSRSTDRLPLDDATQRDITVVIDGESVDITTRARTLAEALAEQDIEVGFYDEVDQPLNGVPTDATITRVSESVETVEEKIPYKTTKTKTDSLTKGTERVDTKGEDGHRTATKRVWRKDGEIIAEEVLAEAVGKEPVNEVVLVGTRPKPKPAPAQASPSTSSSSSSSSAPSTYSGGSPRAIAQDMLSDYGWGQDQWSCLNNLWNRESGWNPSARNPHSGAYGIPQSLPGSKMASAGSDWQTNPATQIKWGLGYIKSRYGSPCGAWAKSESVGWY